MGNMLMGRTNGASVMSEDQEMELAAELLNVSSEEELEQFLGDIFNKVKSAVTTVGRAISPALGPLTQVLKGVAQVGLPLAGKMAGTFFGGPVGGAIGGKLGSMIGGAIKEAEGVLEEAVGDTLGAQEQEQFLGDIVGGLFGELESGTAPDLAVAQRFVKLATKAAQQVAKQPTAGNPTVAAIKAVQSAAQKLGYTGGLAGIAPHRKHSGRWVRHGKQIVIHGA